MSWFSDFFLHQEYTKIAGLGNNRGSQDCGRIPMMRNSFTLLYAYHSDQTGSPLS
jgi:hypothetical protein